jgi:hypothetical protein
MFNSTSEVFSADAKDQIMCLTHGIPKNEQARILELFRENEKIGYGYITVPSIMEDPLVLHTIRYKDSKDIYFKHILSWFEMDFVWYDKETKQVMVWGEYCKVKTAIAELKELLEYALHERMETYMSRDYKDPFKHT